jgi:glycosyltransferase involved in cell wall biosynthesis
MITVVIPCRESENPYTTLRSLAKQTLQPTVIVIVYDEGKGANWARNRGFSMVQTPFVLFSDNDIDWQPDALENLYHTLQAHSQASYAYGWYLMDGLCHSNVVFGADRLRANNYISTMSMIRSIDFPGFDESLQRLQDWDLWLTMLGQGKTGAHCSKHIFTTKRRAGITHGGGISWEDARDIVARKHGL